MRHSNFSHLNNLILVCYSLHTEGDSLCQTFNRRFSKFQSTPSIQRETNHREWTHHPKVISIHSLHTEGDRFVFFLIQFLCCISIHSLHTEGDQDLKVSDTPNAISIHSLHTEGDWKNGDLWVVYEYFNPLPPYRGRRDFTNVMVLELFVFQSTPSIQRETQVDQVVFRSPMHFNPLPPYRGRRRGVGFSPFYYYILCLISLFLASNCLHFTKRS